MHVILIGYAPDSTRRAIAFAERAFAGLPMQRRLLVWNNAGQGLADPPEAWEVIQGSNRLGEFSGWQEGLDRTRRLDDAATAVFLNDTVGAHRPFSAFRRWAFRAELQRAAGSIVGFIDAARTDLGPLAIAGLPLAEWVSTYCFALTSDVLAALGNRLWDPDEVTACVPGGAREATFFSDRISPALRQHLTWWLFGGGWFRGEALTPGNADRLAFKARCICAELLLSARCRALGFELRDPFAHHPLARAADDLREAVIARLPARHGARSARARPC